MATETCDWLHPALSVLGDELGKVTWERKRCDAPAVVLATIGYRRCAEHARLAEGWRLVPPHITDIVAGDFNPYADESFDLYREQAADSWAARAAALLGDVRYYLREGSPVAIRVNALLAERDAGKEGNDAR